MNNLERRHEDTLPYTWLLQIRTRFHLTTFNRFWTVFDKLEINKIHSLHLLPPLLQPLILQLLLLIHFIKPIQFFRKHIYHFIVFHLNKPLFLLLSNLIILHYSHHPSYISSPHLFQFLLNSPLSRQYQFIHFLKYLSSFIFPLNNILPFLLLVLILKHTHKVQIIPSFSFPLRHYRSVLKRLILSLKHILQVTRHHSNHWCL